MFDAFLSGSFSTAYPNNRLASPIKKEVVFSVYKSGTMFDQHQTTMKGAYNLSGALSALSDFDIDKVALKGQANNFTEISEKTKNFGRTIVKYFEGKGIKPSNVFATVEGGISIEIMNNSCYYNIEIYNDLEAVFYKDHPESIPEGWDLNYTDLMKKIISEF